MVKGRVLGGLAAAVVAALVAGACGGGTTRPSPNPGGGGNGGQQAPPNTPPRITSITASDTRIEVGSPVTVTAAVEDTETPVANLTYAWTSDAPGTFAGTGAQVTWTAGPDAKTPGDFTLTLTVTERFTSGSTTAENKTSSDLKVHVNNSPKELADMSLRFLTNFADSKVTPQVCTSEFSDTCQGKKDELGDITDNRHDFLILASTLRPTSVNIAAARTTAVVHTSCAFTSRVITHTPQSGGCLADPASCKFDSVQDVHGDCVTNNVYENGHWALCKSSFAPQGALTAFARAFFGIHRIELP